MLRRRISQSSEETADFFPPRSTPPFVVSIITVELDETAGGISFVRCSKKKNRGLKIYDTAVRGRASRVVRRLRSAHSIEKRFTWEKGHMRMGEKRDGVRSARINVFAADGDINRLDFLLIHMPLPPSSRVA